MNARRLFSLALVLTLLVTLTGAAGSAPLAGPCVPGAAYDPACDANQDGVITVTDIQLTAGHWNQTGTFVSDNNHTHLGQTWTGNNNPLTLTGAYSYPNWAPLTLSNSTGMGMRITSASSSGVFIDSAGTNGVSIGLAGDDGFSVCRAGNVSTCSLDDTNANGFEVANAEDYGARVVYAGRAAFRSDDSGTNGLYVAAAGDSGVWIANATNWAGYFAGNINVTGSCTGCRITQVAVNTGSETLQPGDIVAVDGIAESPYESVGMLLRVRRATPGSPLVGVVSGRAEPFTSSEDGTHTLVPRNGAPAASGDFLSVVIYGPVQVKAASDVQVGQRVAVDEAGVVRGMRRVQVEGVTLDEGGASLGLALDAAKNGLVWVLVNPQ